MHHLKDEDFNLVFLEKIGIYSNNLENQKKLVFKYNKIKTGLEAIKSSDPYNSRHVF